MQRYKIKSEKLTPLGGIFHFFSIGTTYHSKASYTALHAVSLLCIFYLHNFNSPLS